jgi:hypothetical protein
MRNVALLLLCPFAIGIVTGCSGDPAVSKEDEERFKHPVKSANVVLPPDAFKPKGPAFIGKPSGASHPSSNPLPAAATISK